MVTMSQGLEKNNKYDTMKFTWDVQNPILIPIFLYTLHFTYSLRFTGTGFFDAQRRELIS